MTTEQRVVDLIYAGHAISEVANLMGVDENTVKGYIRDVAQVPTSQGGPTQVNTLAPVSGTALQDTSGFKSRVYVPITGAGSGTVAVAIGPDNTVANAIIPAGDATLSRTVSFDLPPKWFFKVTVVTATIAAGTKQVIGG
jgi:hypothetical protein